MTKGVDYYAFVGNNNLEAAFFQADAEKARYGNNPQIQHGNMQIGSDELLPLNQDFTWRAYAGGNEVASRYLSISPVTGTIGDGNMKDMMQTPSMVTDGYALSYGFFDSGSGASGLTNQDQGYVYLTANHSRWMGSLVAQNPALGSAPFGVFALPGAHDAGMNDTTFLAKLFQNEAYVELIGGLTGLGTSIAINTIINAAFTQKDSFTTLLDLGVRMFDFRPGYCAVKINDNLYHQHWAIPGANYADFLQEVLTWLANNPTELVVVNIRFNGFYNDDMKPTPETLQTYWDAALSKTSSNIVAGSHTDLASSYQTLVNANKRLIFLNQVTTSSAPDNSFLQYNATSLDSYTDQAYQTTDGKKISRL